MPDYLYFACDWIIDEDEMELETDLVKAATVLDLEVRDCKNPTGSVTDEGHDILRYTVRVNSKQEFESFLKVIEQYKSLNWFSISLDALNKGCPFEMFFRSLVESYEAGSFKSTGILYARAAYNKQLHERLNTQTPLYYGFDWIIPVQIEDNLMNRYDPPRDAVDRATCSLVRKKSVDTYEVCIGCWLRAGRTSKTDDGFYILQLLTRVFSQEELKLLAINTECSLEGWYSVKPQEYLQGIRLGEHYPYAQTFIDFYLEIERMGQANEELRKKLGIQKL